MALALAGWAVAFVLLFRDAPVEPEPVAPEPVAAPTPATSREPEAPRAAPPRKPAPPAAQEVDRAKLLALIEARAGTLEKCGIGVPVRLLTRITLGLTGEVRAVSFANSDAPPSVAACVRTELETWQLPGVKLKREIEVLVALSIGGPVAR